MTPDSQALETKTMVRNFRSEDEGKHVRTSDGSMVGTIDSTSGSSAHVRPDQDLSRSTRRRLGWTEEGEETYEIRKSHVDRITDDEVRLKEDF